MIRCTIELLPGGDASRARTIGLVEIANYGTYAVVLKKTPPFTGALKAAWRKGRLEYTEVLIDAKPGEDDETIVAKIAGHHRARRGVYDLLFRALKACLLDAREPPVSP